ncbi:MAG: YaiI/YqxD family protein [Tissierella sp.]|uniref:YaiI/YqxD family protein n=1 Tax=Tissierella sp. TaxID=41274 RepID=UPI003F98F744
MKIFVDADGCPVVDIAIEIAKEYDLKIIVVKNFAHKINDSYAKIVSVDIANDSADFYIVNHINKGDIVITQDYGLAALSLAKGAYPINQNGIVYTQYNIDGMLNTRHIHKELRRAGKHHSKFKKRTNENDNKFKMSFKRLLEEKKII